MSTTTAANVTTPSKKVAAELAKVDMNKTPSKPANGKTVTEEEEEDDGMYGKFVGDVDLPEEEEPLLVESSRRFVLFPIRYNEVRGRCHRDWS